MDNIDPFEVVDEVIEENENQEIDLTLDDDLEFHIKQENEDVRSEDGEKDSDNEVDLKKEDNGETVEQNGAEENLNNSTGEVQEDQGDEIHEVQEDELQENQEDEEPQENQEDEEPQNQEASNATNEVEESETLEKEQSGEENNVKAPGAPHPYLYIVETFGHQEEQLTVTPNRKIKNHLETELSVITTKVGLLRLLEKLRTVKEIGVEIKSPPHEYAETICLIQISTGEADYILDALKLKNELMMLTEIFINPKIVKIMFKPKAVLPALQKRLRLFMVNLFDIQGARAALNKPDCTLTAMLRSEFKVEKPLIPGIDCRKRPLPQDYKNMLKIDIHYHVYLYRRYRNELIKQDFGKYTEFLEKCRKACKVVYPDFQAEKFKVFDTELQQRHKCEYEVMKKLYNWRHQLSLKSNINPETILRRVALMKLVRYLPVTEHDIWEYTKSNHVKNDMGKIRTMILELKQTYDIPTERFRPHEQKTAKKRGATGSYGPQNKHPKVYAEFLNKIASDNKEKGKYFLRKNKPERRARQLSPVRSTVTPWAPTNYPENRNYESVFLNPTNVPSPFTFQTNEFSRNEDTMSQMSGSFQQTQMSPGGFPQTQMSSGGFSQAPMSAGSFSKTENHWGNSPSSQNSIQNSYRVPQQNTFRRQEPSFPSAPRVNRRQEFNQMDQQINTLDRKYRQNQGNFNNRKGNFNNRNQDGSSYRRRY